MKLNELYASILRFCGMEVDNDGFVSTVLDDKRHPTIVAGKRMVLPDDVHLRNPKEKLIFHPLSENIMRGESEVIIALRDVINIRLNFTFGIVCQYLLNLIASPDDHKKLTPDQLELLIAVKDVDDVTVRNFVSLMVEGVKQDANRVFTNIYLRRGGTIAEKRYARIGVVMFDFYDKLQAEGNTVYGVKLRVKDKEAYKQLCRFIFPNIEVQGSYNRGSDSDVAPFLDALMRSAMGIASRFNDILDMYKDFIDEADKLYFDSDWVETFENLNVMVPEIRRIPVQAGNEGAVKKTEVVSQEQPKAELPVPPAPVQAPALPPASPIPAHQQFHVQPQFQQHQQQFPAEVSGNGADWNAVKMANASLGFQPNPLGNQLMMDHQQMMLQQQQQRMPSWVNPNQGFNNGFGNNFGGFNNGFNNGFGNNQMNSNWNTNFNQPSMSTPFNGNMPAMRR